MTHFYADVWVSKDGRAHIEVPKRHRIDFPAGTHVCVVCIDTMNGIELKAGVNDCYYNYGGRCIHPVTCRGHGMWLGHQRNWDSTEKCTFTQLGTQKCDNYKKDPLWP